MNSMRHDVKRVSAADCVIDVTDSEHNCNLADLQDYMAVVTELVDGGTVLFVPGVSFQALKK